MARCEKLPAYWRKLLAERINEGVREPFVLAGQEVFVGVSFGIALGCPYDGAEPEALLRDADAAMYTVKQGGKAGYRIFAPSMNEEARVRLRLENDLRQALERDEFAIHYQPKVELKTGRIIGFEALLRWHHPGRDLVGPEHFIPIVEDTGLIFPIGRWVLEGACRQAKGWHEAHPDLLPLTVAVNLSPSQFRANSDAPTSSRRSRRSFVRLGWTRAPWSLRSPKAWAWKTPPRPSPHSTSSKASG